MRRLLLFDVDGTLVDVDGAGREALREALLEVYGETGDIDGFDFHGRTDPAIVRGLLRPVGRSDAWIDARFPRLWSRYERGLVRALEARRRSVAACPGVPELLRDLAARTGWVGALVTGNVEAGAWRKLEACGLADHFGFGAFGSDAERREELPPLAVERARRATGVRFAPQETVVVGDTPEDIRAARASGVRALAVATGRHSARELEAHGPDGVLPALDDLEAFRAAVEAA